MMEVYMPSGPNIYFLQDTVSTHFTFLEAIKYHYLYLPEM